jgi:hypothetical protein
MLHLRVRVPDVSKIYVTFKTLGTTKPEEQPYLPEDWNPKLYRCGNIRI